MRDEREDAGDHGSRRVGQVVGEQCGGGAPGDGAGAGAGRGAPDAVRGGAEHEAAVALDDHQDVLRLVSSPHVYGVYAGDEGAVLHAVRVGRTGRGWSARSSSWRWIGRRTSRTCCRLELTGCWFNEGARDQSAKVMEAAGGRIDRYPAIDEVPETGYGPTWCGDVVRHEPADGGELAVGAPGAGGPGRPHAARAEQLGVLPPAERAGAPHGGEPGAPAGRRTTTRRTGRRSSCGSTSTGNTASRRAGLPVHPDFNRGLPRREGDPAEAGSWIGARPIIVGMDCGRRPAAVVGQAGPPGVAGRRGQAVVLDELVTSQRPEEGGGTRA